MYCPNCGQQRVSNETSFCSRCGFLLTGVTHLLNNGGHWPLSETSIAKKGSSPRSRGLKQGIFISLLTFLVVPIVAIISASLDLGPWGVAIATIVLAVGGVLRMLYSLLFDSNEPDGLPATFPSFSHNQAQGTTAPPAALPPQQSHPASSYTPPPHAAGSWRDATDPTPSSVTESTTRLLEKESGDQ